MTTILQNAVVAKKVTSTTEDETAIWYKLLIKQINKL